MTTYSYAQLEQLWINAGGSTALAPLMAAIAMAESSGNSIARNPSGATGLWQILGAVNASDQSSLTDPAVNAKEAVLKYKSQGLGAWEVYTNGRYKQFLKGNVPPDATLTSAGSGSGLNPLGGLSALTSSLTGFFGQFGDMFKIFHNIIQPSFWLRIGAFFAGLVLLAFGIHALIAANNPDAHLTPSMPTVLPIPV